MKDYEKQLIKFLQEHTAVDKTYLNSLEYLEEADYNEILSLINKKINANLNSQSLSKLIAILQNKYSNINFTLNSSHSKEYYLTLNFSAKKVTINLSTLKQELNASSFAEESIINQIHLLIKILS